MSLLDGRPTYSDEDIALTAKAILSGGAVGIWLQTNEAEKTWNQAEILAMLLGGTIWVCAFKNDPDPRKKHRFDAPSARRLFLEIRRQEVAALKAVTATELMIARMVERHERGRVKNVNGRAAAHLVKPW